jgi:hypothetical protein
MGNEMDLRVSVSSPELMPLLRRAGEVVAGIPNELKVDHVAQPPSADWLDRWAPRCSQVVLASWDRFRRWIEFSPPFVVKVGLKGFPRRVDDLLALLRSFPFELAEVCDTYPEWAMDPTAYFAPSFGNLHFPHGVSCAFRGAGHDRLVSRRWLEFGPWRTIRAEGDLTFVQFHDLAADWRTALEQARVGHEIMGPSSIGGFIQDGYRFARDLDGLYIAAERRLRFLVHGRPVPQREMLDACAARRLQALGPQRPIDHVAYVFAVEAEARAHLHELWLRELECWTFVNGKETRIDLDYHPTPDKPEWVKRLNATDA